MEPSGGGAATVTGGVSAGVCASLDERWETVEEPVPAGVFLFDTPSEVSFDLPSAVPDDATHVRFLLFLRTGHEAPSRSFTVKLHVVARSGAKVYTHVMGARYGQAAISYNSTEHVLPVGILRKLFVQCSDVQRENCHHLQLFVTGWRR